MPFELQSIFRESVDYAVTATLLEVATMNGIFTELTVGNDASDACHLLNQTNLSSTTASSRDRSILDYC